jgi:hypothetical protein
MLAGISCPQLLPPSPRPVHPRACGDLEPAELGESSIDGSSPRLRGSLLPADHHHVGARFIPAPAGISPGRAPGRRTPSVHPRACGDLIRFNKTDTPYYGSSPRLRGSRPPQQRYCMNARFIPAPAGISRTTPLAGPGRTVHPRACGDLGHREVGEPRTLGSSPRLRGSRRDRQLPGRGARFIPAPAGISSTVTPIAQPCTVHPRACGDLGPLHFAQHLRHGSSPRLRGSRRPSADPVGRVRFIPAPAGIST